MKKGIHPAYRPVVFLDHGANFKFLSSSTVACDETIQWEDGKEYPLYRVEISSASHPFFTGKMKLLDITGRVEKFQKKFQRGSYGQKGKAGEQAAVPAATPTEKK
ncbi:type B 50S ribosomal protein L31 [Fimbriiglobus ruber]|uniref:Large ribosomal subunit protein bL31B n=1 Tax=Fimbriiglobus ruber TaxID=1908690 RepID=A0A225DUX6_9BACT|nr:type B 50S ribosomal protein L31 [Fimbriiglobus ruber]OWK40949.1 LSU ribosomal protein L31p [Fimbriiglobus ruber]